NEPFRQIALPQRFRCDFRREPHSGWRLFAKRTGTLAKEFHARCGVILDAPQDIGHCASYAHRLRNNSASGTAGIRKLGHHGFQIAKRMLQGDGMSVGFLCLAFHLLRLRVSKFSSKLGNPGFLRSDRLRKSGDAVLDLTYFTIGLGGLFLSNLMSKQKRLALLHRRAMSLLGSRMLGAERIQFGLLVPKLALHAINFTSLTHLGCTRFVTLSGYRRSYKSDGLALHLRFIDCARLLVVVDFVHGGIPPGSIMQHREPQWNGKLGCAEAVQETC